MNNTAFLASQVTTVRASYATFSITQMQIRRLYKLMNPFNASCSKLMLFEGFNAIVV